MSKTTKIILAVGAVLVLWVWFSYNGFIGLNESADNQWAQVETQYQRRFDLIPNLVATVQGIANQERQVFTALAEARTRYAGARTVEDKVKAANQVETALARLLVIVENYPQLRSAESFQQLMVQLEGAENRISVERGRFNDQVKELNVKVKKFPGNLVASLFGFKERTYFQAAAGAETPPPVNF
ncbi:MAG: LemA family protein [Patescibacteria group bacterium]